MTEMRHSLERELRKEYREIKSSLDFMNKGFEDLANQLKKVETESAELKAANSSLTDECVLVRNKVTDNELRITELEQYTLGIGTLRLRVFLRRRTKTSKAYLQLEMQ
ncbi:hypothetical protein HPB50_029571 [Hyalomma asiaticum]|nr:hypothetical protein HPB50_029571 [Hyalomma asiaticum]